MCNHRETEAGGGNRNDHEEISRGESSLKLAKRQEMLLSYAGVQTIAGLVQVRWNDESTTTPMRQQAYFVESLTLTGLWSRWLESCPLSYVSTDSPSLMLLQILRHHLWRLSAMRSPNNWRL